MRVCLYLRIHIHIYDRIFILDIHLLHIASLCQTTPLPTTPEREKMAGMCKALVKGRV